jgi:hypothetical protein
MFKNENGALVSTAVKECIRGATVSGVLYGIVGFVLLTAGVSLVSYTGVSALIGCAKGAVKSQLNSGSHKQAADILFGALGYAARAPLTVADYAAMSAQVKLTLLVQESVIGAFNSIPYCWQTDPRDPQMPLVAEVGEGFLRLLLRHTGVIGEPLVNDEVASIIKSSIVAGELVAVGLQVLYEAGAFPEEQAQENVTQATNVIAHELGLSDPVKEISATETEVVLVENSGEVMLVKDEL